MLNNKFLNEYSARILSAGLKLGGLAGKLVLIFFMANFLAPEAVGLYGLVLATVTFMTYVVGFDYYKYSTREVITCEVSERFPVIRDSYVLYAMMFVILSPLIAFFFKYGTLPWNVFPWLIVILFVEHFSQEANRFLIALRMQLFASLVFFIRSGFWAIIAIFLMFMFKGIRTVNFVFFAWAVGGGLSCIFSLIVIYSLKKHSHVRPINWGWMKKGVIVAAPFLLATVALRSTLAFDKYAVDYMGGAEVLAAYVFFFGVSSTIISIVDSLVFMFVYPDLVRLYKDREFNLFKAAYKKMLLQCIMASISLAVFIGMALTFLVEGLSYESYSNHIIFLYLSLLAMILFCISMVPHYALYAMNRDRDIIINHIFGFFVFCFFVAIVIVFGNFYQIPLALVFSFSYMAVSKFLILKKKESLVF
ncbi:hypothetical protein [Cellvibrio sp. PSBB006]|uniref:hypothetical protein n=1 Tax=Cellvibrio sp. PSBB006 TaxID=1987723 RepID=UPI000B3B9F54|nr:hypothetical protein [Cellvibrio sp. PSBB006]ARU26810.1 hypothetical protein CBR65_04850 [Cellvibrio sp. PSBB006]